MSVDFFVEHRSMLDREFAQEWDELADRVSAPPFLRPDWFALWAKSFSTPLTFLSARRNRSLAAVLPLVRRVRSAALTDKRPHAHFRCPRRRRGRSHRPHPVVARLRCLTSDARLR